MNINSEFTRTRTYTEGDYDISDSATVGFGTDAGADFFGGTFKRSVYGLGSIIAAGTIGLVGGELIEHLPVLPEAIAQGTAIFRGMDGAQAQAYATQLTTNLDGILAVLFAAGATARTWLRK